jgi:hypothetical protein
MSEQWLIEFFLDDPAIQLYNGMRRNPMTASASASVDTALRSVSDTTTTGDPSLAHLDLAALRQYPLVPRNHRIDNSREIQNPGLIAPTPLNENLLQQQLSVIPNSTSPSLSNSSLSPNTVTFIRAYSSDQMSSLHSASSHTEPPPHVSPTTFEFQGAPSATAEPQTRSPNMSTLVCSVPGVQEALSEPLDQTLHGLQELASNFDPFLVDMFPPRNNQISSQPYDGSLAPSLDPSTSMINTDPQQAPLSQDDIDEIFRFRLPDVTGVSSATSQAEQR